MIILKTSKNKYGFVMSYMSQLLTQSEFMQLQNNVPTQRMLRSALQPARLTKPLRWIGCWLVIGILREWLTVIQIKAVDMAQPCGINGPT